MRIRMLVLALLIVAAMVLAAGLTVCAAVSLSNPAAQSAAADTARLYFPPENTTDFTNQYAAIGRLKLEQWHRIRVFGEEFSACALGYDGGETLLTVDPDDMQRCGPLPG